MRTTESGFNEEVYLTPASEHITAAFELLEAERYALAYYVAGLAVECVFRAYATMVGAEHDDKHDLRRLRKHGVPRPLPLLGKW
jgi:HEPN domain-containing protein